MLLNIMFLEYLTVTFNLLECGVPCFLMLPSGWKWWVSGLKHDVITAVSYVICIEAHYLLFQN